MFKSSAVKKIASVVVLLMLATSCSTAPDAGKPDKKIVIGLSLHNLIDERWQRDRDLFESEAKKSGAEVITLAADGNENTQSRQIEALLEQHIDVLAVVAQNADSLTSVIEKAHRKGVKVLAYARMIKNADVDFYVSIDNVKAGALQAEEIIKKAPKGNYVYIGGGETDNNAVLMHEGTRSVLSQHQDQIQLVADQYSADWKPEEAAKHMKQAIKETHGNIQGVIAANDGTAGAAIEALEAAGLGDGQVPVSGQDAELEALQRIAEGKQTMTLYLPIDKMAKAGVKAALDMAKGNIPSSNNKISNGKIDVPSNLLELVAVNKDNLTTTVIKDGFAHLEDIYIHVPKAEWPQSK